MKRVLPLLLCVFTVLGCQREPSPGPPATPDPAPPVARPADTASPGATSVPLSERERPRAQFTDEALGIAVLHTPGFTLRRDFHRDWTNTTEWKSYAGDAPGTPLLALVLDGSNAIIAAELRIGTSNEASATDHCEDIADSAESAASDEVRIDGQPFRHFRAGDAAMSHYVQVDAYRAVRHGRCFAIDLLISGTRPDVFDPPRQPPFDEATARARLQEALSAVRFTR